MSAAINCAEFEAVLSDYREGVLAPELAAAVRQHLHGCEACAELLAAVASAQLQLAALPDLAVPPNLVARVLAEAPSAAQARATGGWNPVAWLRATLSPRFALGFAMSVFAVALVLNAAQINLRQVFSAQGLRQLAPATLSSTLQRHLDRAWARGVSYYRDLRVVYEIEAAIHQMRQPAPSAAPPAAPSGGPDGGHDRSQRPVAGAGHEVVAALSPVTPVFRSQMFRRMP